MARCPSCSGHFDVPEGDTGAEHPCPRCGYEAYDVDTHVYSLDDGTKAETGDLVYDYYSMKPGVIGEDAGGHGANEGWFDIAYSDGSRGTMNGQRCCSLAHAHKMGWPFAKKVAALENAER